MTKLVHWHGKAYILILSWHLLFQSFIGWVWYLIVQITNGQKLAQNSLKALQVLHFGHLRIQILYFAISYKMANDTCMGVIFQNCESSFNKSLVTSNHFLKFPLVQMSPVSLLFILSLSILKKIKIELNSRCQVSLSSSSSPYQSPAPPPLLATSYIARRARSRFS